MSRSATNTVIRLKLNASGPGERPVDEFPAANGNVKPGHLVTLTSAGKVQPNGTAGASVPMLIAIENNYVSGTPAAGAAITTAYTADDPVYVFHAQPGDIVYMTLKSGQNVAAGASLEAATGGEVQALSTGTRIGIAEEAADATSAAVRIKVRIG